MNIANKIFIIGAGLLFASACGDQSKNKETPAPVVQTKGIKLIDPLSLKLDESNQFFLDASSESKVEARFLFKSEGSYKLWFTALSNQLENCQLGQPTVTLAWQEEGASHAVPLAQSTEFSAESGKSYVLLVAVDNATGCQIQISFKLGSTKIGVASDPSPSPSPEPTPEPKPLPPLDSFNFQEAAFIREFSDQGDTGALFLIRTSSSDKLIRQRVLGPGFLSLTLEGEFDENFANRIFKNSLIPLSKERRQALLEEYRGALAIYFEGYAGRLCTQETFNLVVKSSLADISVESKFMFRAIASPTDDCSFSLKGNSTSIQRL